MAHLDIEPGPAPRVRPARRARRTPRARQRPRCGASTDLARRPRTTRGTSDRKGVTNSGGDQDQRGSESARLVGSEPHRHGVAAGVRRLDLDVGGVGVVGGNEGDSHRVIPGPDVGRGAVVEPGRAAVLGAAVSGMGRWCAGDRPRLLRAAAGRVWCSIGVTLSDLAYGAVGPSPNCGPVAAVAEASAVANAW